MIIDTYTKIVLTIFLAFSLVSYLAFSDWKVKKRFY